MKYTFAIFWLLLLAFGCTKNENKTDVTNQTYFLEVRNLSVGKNGSVTIKTSLEREKTVIIPENSTKRFSIRAAAGEYVTFTVSTKAWCAYRVQDSKGVTIALYESGLNSPDDSYELDFIAFPPDDPEKDFMKYKTGIARSIGDNLIGRTYLLSERYTLKDGVKTDNAYAQESCTFNDEYQFRPTRGESGNFNPERLILYPFIDKSKSSCSYGGGEIIPTNNILVVTNSDNKMIFPIWDRLSIDGSYSMMTYRQLTIDSISNTGVLTMHRLVDDKKEVFVYKPK